MQSSTSRITFVLEVYAEVVWSCPPHLSVRPLCDSPMGMISRVKAPEPRNFSEAPMVYFCSPLWCVWNLAEPAQLSLALCSSRSSSGGARHSRWWFSPCQPQRGPEGLAAGLEPQPLTGFKPRALLYQHKAPFQGPSLPPLSLLSQGPATSWSLGGSVFTAEMGQGSTQGFIWSQSGQTENHL